MLDYSGWLGCQMNKVKRKEKTTPGLMVESQREKTGRQMTEHRNGKSPR